jgi:putative ABC transport system substrate-binding protein
VKIFSDRFMWNIPAWSNVVLLFFALSLPSFPCLSADKNPHKILLLLSGDDKAYTLAADSLTKTLLNSAGRALPFDIDRKLIPPDDGDGDSYRHLFDEKYDVIVPVGTAASRLVKTAPDKTPVFNILTTKEAFDAVWEEERRDNSRQVSAIYLEQPISRQIQFIRLTLPRHKNCGVLLGRHSLHLRKVLGAAAEKSRLRLSAVDISASKTPIDSIKNIIGSNDVILAVPDAEVLTPNTAKWLLYMAYQKEIPVIGFSRAIVDAGALAAIYSTPEQIGRQAAEILLRVALVSMNTNNETWRLPPAQYPEYFEVAINDSVARSLKLRIHTGSYLAQSLLNLERSETWRAQN